MDLIGLHAPKRSGKDTAAHALWLAGYRKVAFADAVRAEVFGRWPQAKSIKDEDKETPQECLHGRSLRDLLIHVGMKRRESDPDYWVKIAVQRIQTLRDQGYRVVVTDVRMHNEANAVLSLGGVIWRIRRPGIEPGEHITERDLGDEICSRTLHNTSSREAFSRLVIGELGEQRCGTCRHFIVSTTNPDYGTCAAAKGDDQARVHSLGSECSLPRKFQLSRVSVDNSAQQALFS
jgi:hypothetical protein